MPLMMPAAVIGIQIIWMAQTVTPSTPNSATLMIIIRLTPRRERPV